MGYRSRAKAEIEAATKRAEAVGMAYAGIAASRSMLGVFLSTLIAAGFLVAGVYDETMSSTMRFVFIGVGGISLLAICAGVVFAWVAAASLKSEADEATDLYLSDVMRRAKDASNEGGE